jgi:hypothetical protein
MAYQKASLMLDAKMPPYNLVYFAQYRIPMSPYQSQ